jgi:hypothetical protein
MKRYILLPILLATLGMPAGSVHAQQNEYSYSATAEASTSKGKTYTTRIVTGNSNFVYVSDTDEATLNVHLQDSSRQRGSHYVHNSGTSSVEVSYNGKIAFTDDEKDIKSISPGGYFKFKKTTFGNQRSVVFEGLQDGTLKRTYHEGRKELPYEPEGRKWVSDVLPEFIENSGIGVEDRVQRIYAREGAKGVLTAATRVNSDYVKAAYYNHLLQHQLSPADLQTMLTHVGTNMSSDYERVKVLRKIPASALENDKTMQGYLSAVTNLGSDYERSRALRHAMSNQKLSDAHYNLALQTLDKMGSDYEKGKIITELLQRDNLSDKHMSHLLRSTNAMGSDYEKGKILAKAASNKKLSPASTQEWLQVAQRFSSDYEKRKIYSSLLKNQQLTDEQFVALIQASESISSSYEKSEMLTSIGKVMPKNNPKVADAYRKAAKTISSDYEYGKVIRLLP